MILFDGDGIVGKGMLGRCVFGFGEVLGETFGRLFVSLVCTRSRKSVFVFRGGGIGKS